MSRVLAVTGVAGYLGQRLIQYLYNLEDTLFDHFVGINIRNVKISTEIPFSFYLKDIRDDFSQILTEQGVTDIVHMAWTLKPTHNRKKAYQVDIEGTLNTLEQAVKAKVTYFLHTSTTLAYGAYPDNSIPLTENTPLKGNKNFHYSYHKALIEQMITDFEIDNPNVIKIGRIRSPAILSSDTQHYYAKILRGGWQTFFLLPYPKQVTPIQFLHTSDALQAFKLMLDQRLEGAYNATPDKDVLVGDIPNILKGRGLRIPLKIMKVLVWIQWKLRILHAPPPYLDFVAYPFIASNQKFKAKGFQPVFSTEETLLSLNKPS